MTDQQLKENGYRNYKGTEIDVYYNIDLCAHAGNCVKGSIEVFNSKRKPWVMADAESAKNVAAIIDTCPTKALLYIIKEPK